MDSLALELFDAYASNLVAVGRSKTPDHMLCPLCLTTISRTEVESKVVPIEHIIPQHSTVDREQKTAFTRLGVKNVRSGLTITCVACNQKKGRELDFRMRGLITPGVKAKKQYSRQAGVAILTYAYLLTFAVFGYEYILQPNVAEIRSQFERPADYVTPYLKWAQVDLCTVAEDQPIVCNRWGYPFIIGWHPSGELLITFWRFRAVLPPQQSTNSPVVIPESVQRLASGGDA